MSSFNYQGQKPWNDQISQMEQQLFEWRTKSEQLSVSTSNAYASNLSHFQSPTSELPQFENADRQMNRRAGFRSNICLPSTNSNHPQENHDSDQEEREQFVPSYSQHEQQKPSPQTGHKIVSTSKKQAFSASSDLDAPISSVLLIDNPSEDDHRKLQEIITSLSSQLVQCETKAKHDAGRCQQLTQQMQRLVTEKVEAELLSYQQERTVQQNKVNSLEQQFVKMAEDSQVLIAQEKEQNMIAGRRISELEGELHLASVKFHEAQRIGSITAERLSSLVAKHEEREIEHRKLINILEARLLEKTSEVGSSNNFLTQRIWQLETLLEEKEKNCSMLASKVSALKKLQRKETGQYADQMEQMNNLFEQEKKQLESKVLQLTQQIEAQSCPSPFRLGNLSTSSLMHSKNMNLSQVDPETSIVSDEILELKQGRDDAINGQTLLQSQVTDLTSQVEQLSKSIESHNHSAVRNRKRAERFLSENKQLKQSQHNLRNSYDNRLELLQKELKQVEADCQHWEQLWQEECERNEKLRQKQAQDQTEMLALEKAIDKAMKRATQKQKHHKNEVKQLKSQLDAVSDENTRRREESRRTVETNDQQIATIKLIENECTRLKGEVAALSKENNTQRAELRLSSEAYQKEALSTEKLTVENTQLQAKLEKQASTICQLEEELSMAESQPMVVSPVNSPSTPPKNVHESSTDVVNFSSLDTSVIDKDLPSSQSSAAKILELEGCLSDNAARVFKLDKELEVAKAMRHSMQVEYKQQLSLLHNQIAQLHDERQGAQLKHFEQLRSMKESHKKEIRQIQSKLKDSLLELENELESTTESLHSVNHERAELSKQCRHLRIEHSKAELKAEEFETINRELREEVFEAKKTITELRTEFDTRRDEQSYSEQLTLLQHELDQLRDNHRKKQKEVVDLLSGKHAKEIAKLSNLLQDAQIDFGERKSHLLRELETQIAQLSKLQEANANLRTDCDSLKQELRNAQKENSELVGDIRAKSQQISRLNKLAAENNQLRHANTQLKETQSSVQEMQNEHACLKGESQHLQEQMNQMKADAKELQSTIEHLRQENQENREEAIDLKSKCEEYRLELLAMRREEKHLHSQLKKSQTATQTAKQLLSEAKATILESQQNIAVKEHLCSSLSNNLQRKTAEFDALNATLQSLHQANSEQASELEARMSIVNNLKKEVVHLNSVIEEKTNLAEACRLVDKRTRVSLENSLARFDELQSRIEQKTKGEHDPRHIQNSQQRARSLPASPTHAELQVLPLGHDELSPSNFSPSHLTGRQNHTDLSESKQSLNEFDTDCIFELWQDEKVALEQNVAASCRTIEKLKDDIAALKQGRDDLQQQLLEQVDERDALSTEMKVLFTERSHYNTQIKALQEQLHGEQVLIAALANEKDQLLDRLTVLTREQNENMEKIQKQEQTIQEMTEMIGKQNQELEQEANVNKTLHAEMETLQQQNADISQDLDKAEVLNAKTQAEIVDLESELNDLKLDIADLSLLNERYSDDLKRAEEDYIEAHAQIEDYKRILQNVELHMMENNQSVEIAQTEDF